MINIKNKIESDTFIINSGMNYTPFALVRNYVDVIKYVWNDRSMSRLPFSIRFKGTGMQPFLPNLTPYEVCDFCREHFKKDDTPLGIYEATEGYDDYRTVNCEIRINSDATIDAHYCRGNKKMRDALKSPDAKHVVRKGMNYKPLRWAVNYLCKYNILGPVVELTLFSKKVGVKNDYVVCWEVRNF
jgi:hypothetical protein